MKIISSFHPSSSVLSSIKCRLTSRDLEHLVIGKLSRIDVYSVQPQELQHECGLDVFGKICSLKALPISVSKKPCCMYTNNTDYRLRLEGLWWPVQHSCHVYSSRSRISYPFLRGRSFWTGTASCPETDSPFWKAWSSVRVLHRLYHSSLREVGYRELLYRKAQDNRFERRSICWGFRRIVSFLAWNPPTSE